MPRTDCLAASQAPTRFGCEGHSSELVLFVVALGGTLSATGGRPPLLPLHHLRVRPAPLSLPTPYGNSLEASPGVAQALTSSLPSSATILFLVLRAGFPRNFRHAACTPQQRVLYHEAAILLDTGAVNEPHPQERIQQQSKTRQSLR